MHESLFTCILLLNENKLCANEERSIHSAMIRGMNDRPLKYKVNGHVPSLNGHIGYIVDDLCKNTVSSSFGAQAGCLT